MKKDKIIPELTWIVRETEIVFSVADEAIVRVSKDRFLTLLDGRAMTELFRLQSKTDFDQWDSAEWYARTDRYLRKGLSLDQAAQAMRAPGEHQTDITGETLRKLWANFLAYHRGEAVIAAEIERQGREEGDYCKTDGTLCKAGEEPTPLESGTPLPEIFVDALIAARLLKEWGGVRTTAATLHLDLRAFEEWIEKNRNILEVLG
jgi:hypothetical protein